KKVHGLGRGSGFVEQRSVRYGQAGEVDDYSLKIDQRLQSALGNLCLVRSIRGVPTRILQNASPNLTRRMTIVISGAYKRSEDLIFFHFLAESAEKLRFRQRRGKVQAFFQPDGGGNGLVYEFVQ